METGADGLETFVRGLATVRIDTDKLASGRAAAREAADVLKAAIEKRGAARVIIGTGPSQDALVRCLVQDNTLLWNRIEVFHMDEYIGIDARHPASFRRWLHDHVATAVSPAATHLMGGDAPDTDQEMQRYADELARAPIDLCFVGFGENGHIAFNDPHEADFQDKRLVKPVTLDAICRRQQVGEGHFLSIEDVPTHAMTLTCPALMRAERLICCVPDRRKANAVKDALEGPTSTDCPASLVLTHPRATIYLDQASASLLSGREPAVLV